MSIAGTDDDDEDINWITPQLPPPGIPISGLVRQGS